MSKKYSASRALFIEELAHIESEKLAKKVDDALLEMLDGIISTKDLCVGVDLSKGESTMCIMKVLNPGTKKQSYEVVKIL